MIYAALCWGVVSAATGPTPGDAWPGFRGDGSSHAGASGVPLMWSDKRNLAWRVDLPGEGMSCPVVWRGRVYVVAADPRQVADDEVKDLFHVCAFDLETGEEVWRASFTPGSTEVSKGINAAPTPCVDAEGVYVLLESGELMMLDHAGELVWERSLLEDYGEISGSWGLAASPALLGDTLYVLNDNDKQSYLLAVDRKTGKTRWKTDRDTKQGYASPVAVQTDAGPRVYTCGEGWVGCVDGGTGEPVWWVEKEASSPTGSPTVTDGLVIFDMDTTEENLVAVRRGGRGDVTESHVAWTSAAKNSYGSPLAHDGRLYVCDAGDLVRCLDLADGSLVFAHRCRSDPFMSPVLADGRVYWFMEEGKTYVTRPGDRWVRLAGPSLTLSGNVWGVAVVDGCIVFRSNKQLACVKTPKPQD